MAAKKRQGVSDAPAPKGKRLNVHIDPDAHERLSIHAIKSGKKPGQIVQDLIEAHLKAWRVQKNPDVGTDRLGSVAAPSPASLAVVAQG